MIDPSNCVRYIISEGVESAAQKLISWLSDSYPEISLIHQESHIDRRLVTTQLTFVHRYWGPTVKMEIVPIESTQTLVLIPPPDPGDENMSPYEDKILELLPGSSASIRFMMQVQTPDLVRIPDYIRLLSEAHERSAMSLREVAKASDLDPTYVHYILKGARRPQRDVLIALGLIYRLERGEVDEILLLAGLPPLGRSALRQYRDQFRASR